MALFNFNAAEHNAQQSFEALPKGWYQARLVESEIKATKTGGQQLQFTAEILGPQFAVNRKVFLRYNVHNANSETVRIAMEQLAAMSIAIGVPQWTNSEQLHNRPFHLKLKFVKGDDNYEDSNDAAGYDQINVNRQLAVKPATPVIPGQAAPAAAFPGTAPAVATPTATFPGASPASASVPPSASFPTASAPTQSAPAQTVAAPQPAVQQTAPQVQQAAPVQEQTAAPVWQNAPAQPWNQPQAAAPQEAVQQQPTQPVVEQQQAQAQPVNPPVTEAQPEWAQQTVALQQPQAQAPQQAQAVEPQEAHPAQAAVPPWQQTA